MTTNLSQNRKARHDYEVLETFEAGIALQGTEVKSCRKHDVNLLDAHASVDGGELWLHGAHIAPYSCGNRQNHEPRRPRRLLMHAKEIRRLKAAVETKGMTLVPLRIYLVKGRVKVELALARGRNVADHREDLRKRDSDREMHRLKG